MPKPDASKTLSLHVNLARHFVAQTRSLPFVLPLTSIVLATYLVIFAGWSLLLAGTWLLAILALSITRWVMLRRFDISDPQTDQEAKRWQNRFTCLELVSGALCGGICLLLPDIGLQQSMIPLLVVVGQVTTAVSPLSSSRPAFLAYALSALGACALWLAISGEPSAWLLIGALVSAVVLLFATFCSVHKELIRAIKLQISHQQISARLLATNAELEQQRQQTEHVSRIKRRFLANMSQELRAPMNGLLGALSVLGRQRMDREQEMLTSIAYRTGKSMMALLNEILDLSRRETSECKAHVSSFDGRTLFEDVIELLSCSAQLKELRLLLHLPPDFPGKVRGDLTRIRQILLNLIGNAIKFTDCGSVTVTARISDGLLQVEISDTGPGISQQQQHQLFSKVDQPEDVVHLTRGQGLSVCSELCTLMGGEIGVRSELGAGSTFWLNLPLESLDPPKTIATRQPTVVLVSDDVGVRQMLSSQLGGLGYPTSSVESTEPLLHLLMQSRTPCRVMLDMDMKAKMPLCKFRELQAVAADHGHHLVAFSCLGAHRLAEAKHRLLLPCRLGALEQVLAQDSAGAEDWPPADPPLASESTDGIEQARALVVDDSDINRLLLKRMLQELDWSVDLAESLDDASHFTRQQQYQLIIVDAAAANASKATAVDSLHPGDPGARLLLVGDPADPQVTERLHTEGADALLRRPITLEHLEATLNWECTQGAV